MVKINNVFRASMVLCFLIGFQLTTACSLINYNKGYKTYPQEGWTELTIRDDALYRYQYQCNSFSIYVRNAILTKTSGYWGLPIIPIPVIPFSRKYDSLIFDIYIDNTAGPDEPLNVELRIPSTGEVLTPVKSVTLSYDVLKEWNLLPIYYDNNKTFLYKFGLINEDVKDFEIIFPSETLGCSIPSLNFKAKCKTKYAPIKIPLPK